MRKEKAGGTVLKVEGGGEERGYNLVISGGIVRGEGSSGSSV